MKSLIPISVILITNFQQSQDGARLRQPQSAESKLAQARFENASKELITIARLVKAGKLTQAEAVLEANEQDYVRWSGGQGTVERERAMIRIASQDFRQARICLDNWFLVDMKGKLDTDPDTLTIQGWRCLLSERDSSPAIHKNLIKAFLDAFAAKYRCNFKAEEITGSDMAKVLVVSASWMVWENPEIANRYLEMAKERSPNLVYPQRLKDEVNRKLSYWNEAKKKRFDENGDFISLRELRQVEVKKTGSPWN
jgi:hypothetical protein